jgi:formylglycine-generating enzyme
MASIVNRIFLLIVLVVFAVGTAQADTITRGTTSINMDFVAVGDPGNAPDTSGDPNPCGSVGYRYNIGMYEVTADQWAAVIAADPNVGNAGNWSGSQPTAGTSWYEAAKFCNWLTTGRYDKGYYAIDGLGYATPNPLKHDAYAALHGTTFFIPTEDEWYKAAYYDGVNDVYYDFPTGSNSEPDGIDFAGDTTFDVVFTQGYNQLHPNSVTDSGAASPYGTVAQGGNVWEWNETISGSARGLRGGGYTVSYFDLRAQNRGYNNFPTSEGSILGFRVSSVVPEPSVFHLFGGGAIGLLFFVRRKCK